MSKYFIVMFCLISLVGFTQSSEKRQKDFEKALTIINDPMSHDTAKAMAYVRAGAILAPKSLDTLLYYSELANSFIDEVLAENPSDKISKRLYNEKSEAINQIGYYHYVKGDVDVALQFMEESIEFSKLAGNAKSTVRALNNLGALHARLDNHSKALSFYKEAIEQAKIYDFEEVLMSAYNNLALYYDRRGEYQKGINLMNESLMLSEKKNNLNQMATAYHNLGTINENLKEYETAISYYNKSLQTNISFDNKKGQAEDYNVMSDLYLTLKNYDSTFTLVSKAINLNKELGNISSLSTSYNTLGDYYYHLNQLDSAENYYKLALTAAENSKTSGAIVSAKNRLSRLYFKQKKFNLAESHALEAKKFKTSKINLQRTTENLYLIYKQKGKFDLALSNYEEFISLRDSLQSEDNQKMIIKQKMQYDYDSKVKLDSIAQVAEKIKNQAQIEAKDAEISKSRTQKIALGIILALLLIFAVFIYNRFRITRQQRDVINSQKLEVENQKEVVEEKNKEILDSINYASRLQQAILPSKSRLAELPEHFIYYQPKDIVAGDFYWLESIQNQIFIAAADCTGHGVPGAMVSVVCSQAMSKAVAEEGITEPAKILDRTREIVIKRFDSGDDEVKDGMDVSLCALDLLDSKSEWAGANNPLYIINPKREFWPEEAVMFKDCEIGCEIKPDKQPIGKYHNEKAFTNHQFELVKGDMLYMFSDGFPDQFGGDSRKGGKKYKASNFKKFLIEIADRPMAEQKQLLEEEFKNWSAGYEQLDDICIIGIKC